MARVFRKGRDGIYFAWGWLRDGSRWTRSTGTRKKRDAERLAVEIERDVQREADAAAHEAASLGWALSRLIESLRAGGRAKGTIRNAEIKAGHLVRIFGTGRELSFFEPPEGIGRLAAYVHARVGEGAARSSVAIEHGILKQALNLAARDGLFRGSTRALSVTELRGAHKPRKRWLTAPEARALLSATPPQWRDHVEVYLGIGVRRMELYQIEAKDIDAKGNRVHVRGTKTERADRWVPMPPNVRRILERRAKVRPHGPLFAEWTRAHSDLIEICQRADLARTSVSDLRRTFASLMLSSGVSASVLKELMGHATTRQIDLVYGHATEDARQQAAASHPLGGRPRDGSRAAADLKRRPGTEGTDGKGNTRRKSADDQTS